MSCVDLNILKFVIKNVCFSDADDSARDLGGVEPEPYEAPGIILLFQTQ